MQNDRKCTDFTFATNSRRICFFLLVLTIIASPILIHFEKTDSLGNRRESHSQSSDSGYPAKSDFEPFNVLGTAGQADISSSDGSIRIDD